MLSSSIVQSFAIVVGTVATASAATTASHCKLPVDVNVLYEFEYPSWAENAAVRSNGQILVTRLDTPEIYQVDPTGKYEPILIATWNASEYMGCLGISETVKDEFYVNLAAFVGDDFVKESGVNAVYKVDLTTFELSSEGEITSNATVSKLTDIPDADFLNGLTTLDDSNILTADVYNGWIYKVNVETGIYSIAINDPKMKFTEVANPPTNLGSNGIKIFDSHLYWSNTAAGTLNKIKINSDGEAIGNSSVVTANVPKADDFIIRSDGTAFVCQNQMDELSVLAPGSSVAQVIAGSNTTTTVAGVSSAHFGRLPSDSHILYLTTSGALGLPINGSVTVAGTVSYIDTSCFKY